MATGFYLLDNKNPNGKKYHPTRIKPVEYVVVHTAQNLPDLEGPDTGAEAVARYFATTSRDASAHENVDTDSFVRLLPDSATAWAARGYNANGWHLEICTQAEKWAVLPADYRDRLYRMAAARARRAALELGVPLVRTHVGGPKGFLPHSEIDPTRRSDPGKDFDWDYYMSLVNEKDAGPTQALPAKPSRPMGAVASAPPAPRRPLRATTKNRWARMWQAKMASRGWKITVDGIYGPDSAEVAKKFQKEKGLVVDGIVGPATWRATWTAPVTR